MDLDVPAYFTSYNQSEAEQDLAMLQSVNAKVLQDNVSVNPFRESYPTIEAPTVEMGADQFFACNMYGVLFCGRTE